MKSRDGFETVNAMLREDVHRRQVLKALGWSAVGLAGGLPLGMPGVALRIPAELKGLGRMGGLRRPDRDLAGRLRHGVADGKKIVDGRALLARTIGAVIGQNRLKWIVLPHDPGQFRERIAPPGGGRLGLRGARLGELPLDLVEVDGKTGLY